MKEGRKRGRKGRREGLKTREVRKKHYFSFQDTFLLIEINCKMRNDC
jgi:hypothetical protein